MVGLGSFLPDSRWVLEPPETAVFTYLEDLPFLNILPRFFWWDGWFILIEHVLSVK